MVFSNDGTFEIVFFDPFRQVAGKPLVYKHLMTPEGICLIGEVDQNFQIEITCKDRAVYGVRVIVDGFTIQQKKTFRQKGKITGFPQGNGDFRCFKFQKPLLDVESQNKFLKNVYRPPWDDVANDVRDYKGGAGELVIKLYETKQMPSRGGGGGGGGDRQVEPFIPLAKNENKDEFDQTLGIGEGEVVQMPRREPSGDRPPKEFYDAILYEEIVQSFRLIYKDTASLVQKGYIKLNNHNDLSYLTEEYFVGNESAMIQILQTILESGQKDVALEEIQQTVEVLIERLEYYCQSFDLLNLFMSKEAQEQVDSFGRQGQVLTELVKFMEGYPEFFKKINENTFGIQQRFDLAIYNKKTLKVEGEQQQQIEQQKQQQQIEQPIEQQVELIEQPIQQQQQQTLEVEVEQEHEQQKQMAIILE